MPQKSYLIILCFCSILACSNQPGSNPPPKEYFSEEAEDEPKVEPLKPGIKVQFEVYQFDTTLYSPNADKGNRARLRWANGIDLFGIACD